MLRIPLPKYADGTLTLLGKCALARQRKSPANAPSLAERREQGRPDYSRG